jgi:hypothetical protein
MAYSRKFTCVAVSEEIPAYTESESDFDEMTVKVTLWPVPTRTIDLNKPMSDEELLENRVFFNEDLPIEINMISIGGSKSEFRVGANYTLTIQKSRKTLVEIGEELEVLERAGVPDTKIGEMYPDEWHLQP